MARLGNEQRAESAVLRNLLQVRPAAARAARRSACNPIAGVILPVTGDAKATSVCPNDDSILSMRESLVSARTGG